MRDVGVIYTACRHIALLNMTDSLAGLIATSEILTVNSSLLLGRWGSGTGIVDVGIGTGLKN